MLDTSIHRTSELLYSVQVNYSYVHYPDVKLPLIMYAAFLNTII
jgi:hypothetical protein